jgi:hypothetical protein
MSILPDKREALLLVGVESMSYAAAGETTGSVEALPALAWEAPVQGPSETSCSFRTMRPLLSMERVALP